jgi:hypothetical protein
LQSDVKRYDGQDKEHMVGGIVATPICGILLRKPTTEKLAEYLFVRKFIHYHSYAYCYNFRNEDQPSKNPGRKVDGSIENRELPAHLDASSSTNESVRIVFAQSKDIKQTKI